MINDIKKLYFNIEGDILLRLNDFKQLWIRGDEKEIFGELIFCILTPQSKATLCWKCVNNLFNKDILLKGDKDDILKEIIGVRFKYKKADYIIKAREQFLKNGKLIIKEKITQFNSVYNIII